MEDCLYDTSWTLHTITRVSPSFAAFSAVKDPTKQLKDYLTSTANKKRAHYENEQEDVEKTGDLREVTFQPLEFPAILISITYERAISKFILYGKDSAMPYSLLLTRAAVPLVHTFTSFLSDIFLVSTTPLKLPSTFLYDTLKEYMSTMAVMKREHRDSLMRATLSNLKLTFSFLPPVAPQLRTIDIDVPVSSLIAQPAGRTILRAISTHLQQATGIYPLETDLFLETKEWENREGLARISRVSCAAFTLSVEGKLKFTENAIESAVQFENTVRRANKGILDAIVTEVMKEKEAGT